MEEAEVAPIHA